MKLVQISHKPCVCKGPGMSALHRFPTQGEGGTQDLDTGMLVREVEKKPKNIKNKIADPKISSNSSKLFP